MSKLSFFLVFSIFSLALLPQAFAFNESLGVNWLKAQQASDGSFDLWFPPHTALAAIAINDFEPNSSSVWNASNWMITDLQNNASWSWAEADIPGAEIYALALAGNANTTSLAPAYAQLLAMQDATGGFAGWWSGSGIIPDAASTAFSILGLNAAGALPSQNASAAKNYIYSLQNAGGEFNLTVETNNSTLSALAPDLQSSTAAALLALSALGENSSSQNISLALNFLKNGTDLCFENKSFAYSAAISALAFNAFNESEYASKAINYLKTLQDENGSFLDERRSSGANKVMDTAIALHAASTVNETQAICGQAQQSQNGTQNSTQNSSISIQVGVVTLFPNGTSVSECLSVPQGSTAEDAIKASGLQSEWAASAYGDSLAKIADTGCPASDAWCQCADWNVCCLTWNFWALNSSNGQWEYSMIGYGAYALQNQSVFGSVWTASSAKSPSPTSFSQICGNETATTYYNQTNETDAQACNSCTANSQCTSNYCENSTCTALATPTPTPTVSPTPSPEPTASSTPTSPTPTPVPAPVSFGSVSSSSSSATPTPTPVTLKIDFPSTSGKSDFSQTVEANSCAKAYDCFAKVATISCTWGTYGCFVTAVNGVQSTFEKDGSWWAFKANNALSMVGVSQYTAKPGDTLELYLTTQKEEVPASQSTPQTSAPSSSAASTPSPTPTAAPSISPSPTATVAPSATPTQTPAPTLQANSKPQATPQPTVLEITADFTGESNANTQLTLPANSSQNNVSPLTALATAAQTSQNALIGGLILLSAIVAAFLFARQGK